MNADDIRTIIREELAAQSAQAPAAQAPAAQAPALNTSVPLPLKEAAAYCHCDQRWLLRQIQAGVIRGFQAQAGACWRVYVQDVIKYLTTICNIKPARQLRRVA